MHLSLAAETLFTLWGFPVTNSLIAAVALMLTLCVLALLFRRTGFSVKNGWYNAVEAAVEGLEGLVTSVIGQGSLARRIVPLAGTFFVFILLANWTGIFPFVGSVGFELPAEHGGEHATIFAPLLRSTYSDLNMTLALAIISVFMTQVFGFQELGMAYGKKFLTLKHPIQTFVGVLEIISEFVKVFSFSFRLFGNIFAGEVLLTVIGFLVPFVGPVPFLGIELFAGAIQALIFTMLTLVFISGAVTSHDDNDEHHATPHSTSTPAMAH